MNLPFYALQPSKGSSKGLLDVLLDAIPPSIRQNPTHLSNYQYPALILLGAIDFIMMSSAPLIFRLAIYSALTAACLLPFTRHFFIPALPIFAWLITFFGCRYFPSSARSPHIFVNVLASLERVLYGGSLSSSFSSHPHWILDIMAWVPYGLIHFALPFLTSLIIFWFGPPGSLPVFAHAFGYLNLSGVLTQLILPTAPPWYEELYGIQPATYSIPGSPAGLARVDDLLGIPMYASTFSQSPLVFGAFPSLHSGTATIQALFMIWLFPRGWPLFIAYVLWIWWATMYLSHHYLIDLVGGSMYAVISFFLARRWLPEKEEGARDRWAYSNSSPTLLAIFQGERKSMRVHLEAYQKIERERAIILLGEDDEEAMILLMGEREEEIFILEEISSNPEDLVNYGNELSGDSGYEPSPFASDVEDEEKIM